jgi:signal transduction histidine kinase
VGGETRPDEIIVCDEGQSSMATIRNADDSETTISPATEGSSNERESLEPQPEPDIHADPSLHSAQDALQSQVLALQGICSLGVLASSVIHELNNALTPILNYAKLALRNPDGAYRERALAQIIEAAQRAAAITQGMLRFSRSGGQLDHREPTDLARLLEDVILLERGICQIIECAWKSNLRSVRGRESIPPRSSRCYSTY